MSSFFTFPLPHATRKQVFTALFEFASKAAPPIGETWNTQSQHLLDWDAVSAANQPAMFLQRGPQIAEQKHVFGVIKWHWKSTIWVYYRTDGLKTENTYPDQLTDQFIDNFEQLFQTDPLNGRLTLGGLVYHCWIDGTIFFDSGINDNQAIIILPISILI